MYTVLSWSRQHTYMMSQSSSNIRKPPRITSRTISSQLRVDLIGATAAGSLSPRRPVCFCFFTQRSCTWKTSTATTQIAPGVPHFEAEENVSNVSKISAQWSAIPRNMIHPPINAEVIRCMCLYIKHHAYAGFCLLMFYESVIPTPPNGKLLRAMKMSRLFPVQGVSNPPHGPQATMNSIRTISEYSVPE